jgi:hypothetical protein
MASELTLLSGAGQNLCCQEQVADCDDPVCGNNQEDQYASVCHSRWIFPLTVSLAAAVTIPQTRATQQHLLLLC